MYPWDTTAWGKEALWISLGGSIDYYNVPNGKIVGSLFYNQSGFDPRIIYNGDSMNYYRNQTEISGLNDSMKYWIRKDDMTWVGHSGNTLVKIMSEADGFYEILSNTFRGGVWISIDYVSKNKMHIYKYRDLILGDTQTLPEPLKQTIQWAKVGVNLVKSCMRLREEPSLTGKELTCIPSNDWNYKIINHLKIIRTEGNWAYVSVTTQEWTPGEVADEDCTYTTMKEQKGWIKAIDDNGYPNIWYSTTSY